MTRPGWQTTEFWLTLAKGALAVAVCGGWLQPMDAADLGGQLANGIVAVATVIASAGAIIGYTRSRVRLKREAATH